jgi:5-methyltetrahydrofolate--homocysteine methyltransferase
MNKMQLCFHRQQIKKAPGQPNLSLADFISPATANKKDHIGAFAVSIHGIEPHLEKFEAAHDDYNKIMLQALADRFAEAFAEALHLHTRKEYWGYDAQEQLSPEELIKEQYKGIRPAPGYPACPDHTEKYKLFDLLSAQDNAGISLTESLAMYQQHHQFVVGIFRIHRVSILELAKLSKTNLKTMQPAKAWTKPLLRNG